MNKKTFDPISDLYEMITRQSGLCVHSLKFLFFVVIWVRLLSHEVGWAKLSNLLQKISVRLTLSNKSRKEKLRFL